MNSEVKDLFLRFIGLGKSATNAMPKIAEYIQQDTQITEYWHAVYYSVQDYCVGNNELEGTETHRLTYIVIDEKMLYNNTDVVQLQQLIQKLNEQEQPTIVVAPLHEQTIASYPKTDCIKNFITKTHNVSIVSVPYRQSDVIDATFLAHATYDYVSTMLKPYMGRFFMGQHYFYISEMFVQGRFAIKKRIIAESAKEMIQQTKILEDLANKSAMSMIQANAYW